MGQKCAKMEKYLESFEMCWRSTNENNNNNITDKISNEEQIRKEQS